MFRQRGALTVITPLLMVLVILLGVMALDGARLFSLRKEMQSQVNAAATAAALSSLLKRKAFPVMPERLSCSPG